ncbi:DHH family phosphoesterase [Arabiibacter massiliensis]|uniref:DHH family phosphoesterase n=1 Tax=Arabiibacter massiliensis TaxID=1870985 RepID=UPI0009BA09AF|nr:bifunctional oligoribonuclease/PAP phosphatase NrnA [Arabiibacter massiliensis]
MAVTPQTNTSLASIAEALREHDDFVVCGHVSPDGDCIGSQLALAVALRSIGKRAACLLAKDEAPDARLAFLPGFDELVFAGSFDGAARTFVAVDVPTRERIGEHAAALRDACGLSVVVDHHAVDSTMADLTYVDPAAASTTMLVWELAGLLGADRSGDVALCCYTGLVTDTGRFQYQNTDAAAMRAASEMVEAGADPAAVSRAIFQNRSLPSVRLESIAVERMRFGAGGACALSWISHDDFEAVGASKADAEPIIDALRSVAGVRVACMLREQGDAVRGSLRAKDGTDVAAVARSFGGGGHVAAAGFTLECPLPEAVAVVERALEEALES